MAPTPPVCSDSGPAFRIVVSEFQGRQQNVALSVGIRHCGVTVFREATGCASLENQVPVSRDTNFYAVSPSGSLESSWESERGIAELAFP